jgi:putative membrane protein
MMFPVFVVVALASIVISGIAPKERATWALEVAPVAVALVLLVWTRKRFALTPLAYALISMHSIILSVGGHYTYAEVPIGFWLERALDLSRNHYDRLGHLAQGFVPALITREILIRCSPLKRGAMLSFVVVCICLAISAFYEMIEWWTALIAGDGAVAFLGTQGDVWDTQWDMFLALLGALICVALLSRAHDRALARLPGAATAAPGDPAM